MEAQHRMLLVGAAVLAATVVVVLTVRRSRRAEGSSPCGDGKKRRGFRCFLSHFKREAGTEARLVQQNLRHLLPPGDECFLDSDDLNDLRLLLDHVKHTKTLVLLQTKSVLTRPWVLVELYTAIINRVPIVALNIRNSYEYEYARAVSYLMHMDEEIELANPGAAQLLVDMGIDPVDVAWRLSDCLPNIISIDLSPNGSERQIRASLEDLIESMNHATPIEPSQSKEEWLAKRAAFRTSRPANLAVEQHGKVATSPANARPSISAGWAEVPATVPELPTAFKNRPADLRQLKAALTTPQKGGQKKVQAHGMGGVGKTTLAVALVHDEGIRRSFEKILWVSVGQEPDIRELQDSLHHQITKQHLPPAARSAADVVTALRDAARGKRTLLVLDDVWEAKYEKALSCIDPDNDSRCLITSRIKALVKNSVECELGILSEEDAFELLLSSADMSNEDVGEGSEERRIAKEIVELCGKLPLTLALAGGMISDNPNGFTDEVLELMKEDRLRSDEDESGTTLEWRIVASSLKMIPGKNAELVERCFLFFAAFGEDVAIPAGVFDVVASLLTSEKRAKLSVGSALVTLLKYNLLKGSLSGRSSGLFLHDIVRDYVLSRHSPDEIRALQKSIVAAFLSARPEPDGFLLSDFTAENTFLGYVARHIHYHFKGALGEDEDPRLVEWVSHPDLAVLKNVTRAVGVEKMVGLSEAFEKSGEIVRSARFLWAASLDDGISIPTTVEYLNRAGNLLAKREDDSGALELELLVIGKTVILDFFNGQKYIERLAHIGKDNSEAKRLEGLARSTRAALKMTESVLSGNFEPTEVIAAFQLSHECYQQAAKLPGAPEPLVTWASNIAAPWMLVFFSASIDAEAAVQLKYTPEALNCSEAGIVGALRKYDEGVRAYFMRLFHYDPYLQGNYLTTLAFQFGNVEVLNIWMEKMLTVLRKIDLPNSRSNVWARFIDVTIHTYMVLGRFADARVLLTAAKFSWDSTGFESIAKYAKACKRWLQSTHEPAYYCFCRLLMFIVYDSADEDEVNEWIPTPAEMAELETKDAWMKVLNINDLVSTGVQAYLKLGREEDAYELAKIGVSPKHKTTKKFTIVRCYSFLGQIAARRGHTEEANRHFAAALKAAQTSCYPLLAVLVGRDWKQCALSEPAVDVAIDAACAKMRKTREQLASLLL